METKINKQISVCIVSFHKLDTTNTFLVQITYVFNPQRNNRGIVQDFVQLSWLHIPPKVFCIATKVSKVPVIALTAMPLVRNSTSNTQIEYTLVTIDTLHRTNIATSVYM